MEETQDDNENACNEYIIQEITVIGDKPIIGLGVSETVKERLLVIHKGESLSKFIERVTRPLSDLKTEFELKAVKSDESIKSDDVSKRPTDAKTPTDESSLDDKGRLTSKSAEEKAKSDDVSGVKPLRDGSKEDITSVKDLEAKVSADKEKSDVEPSETTDKPSTEEPTPKVEHLPIDVRDESVADQPSRVSSWFFGTGAPTVPAAQPDETVPSSDEQLVSGAPADTTTTAGLTSDEQLLTSTTPTSSLDTDKSDEEKQREADAAKIDTTKPEIEGDTKLDEPIKDLAAVASRDVAAVKAKIDDIQSTLGTTSTTKDDKQRGEISKGISDESTSEPQASRAIVSGFSSDITTPADDDTDNEDEDIEALVYSIMSKVDKLFAKDF